MPLPGPLCGFLRELSSADHAPRPEAEEWTDLIERISRPLTVADIDEETYWYFLEVLPPKFMGGGVFAFAEGAEPFRLFWRNGKSHFCRQLTWDETRAFCHLVARPFPYWD